TPRRADERVLHFEWERLGDLDLFYSGGRGLKRSSRSRRHPDLWENFPCGHETALRKLGSILDADGASSLSVDEVRDGLDVSYMRPNPERPKSQERHQKLYSPEELCS